MSFFISRIVAEENPEQNYESSTYNYVPYSGDYNSNAPSEMDGSDSYYSGPNEDLNYGYELDANYNVCTSTHVSFQLFPERSTLRAILFYMQLVSD